MGLETILIGAVVSAAFSTGQYLVSYALAGRQRQNPTDNARQIDPRVQGSKYGAMIPRCYGEIETAGQVIWATSIKDTVSTIPGQKSKRGSTPDQINHVYSRSFGILLSAVPASGVVGVRRIKFDDKTFYESATMGDVLTDKLEIKLGGESQLPNTWYEADKGAGMVSAHRGYVTLWFHDIDLSPYGDRIPNVRVELVQAVSPSLASVVTDECAVAGLTAGQINVTELATKTVSGYIVNTQGAVRSSLEQLSLGYQFDGIEYDGKINFRSRPRASVCVVPYEDLGTVEEDESSDTDELTPFVALTRRQSAELASEVSVLYFDKERDYEEGAQSYRRQNFTTGAPVSYSLNLVLPPVEASRLAKVLAVTSWTERMPGKFSLPPEYFIYAPGDVLTIPLSGDANAETVEMRIEKMSFAAPGVVRVECTEQFAESYTQTGDAGGEGEAAPVPPDPEDTGEIDLWLGDYPALLDRDLGRKGYYAAGARVGGNTFAGYSVVRDRDGAGDYESLIASNDEGTIGSLTTSLAADSSTAARLAAKFTRANAEYLSRADNALLSGGNVDFAITGWVYLDSLNTSQALASKYTTSVNQREWIVRFDTVTQRFVFTVSSNGTALASVTATGVVPVAGRWYFIAAWHDATGDTINIQIDNGTIYSAAHTTGVFNSTAAFLIGATQVGTLTNLDGRAASVNFWKRLLTASERTLLYNGGAGLLYSGLPVSFDKTNLISWWNLTEAAGQRNDSHSNLYHLTDNNTVTSAAGIPGSRNTFFVSLPAGHQLASITPTTFANTETANLAVIEQGGVREVVQFRDVIDRGGNIYQVDFLKRNLRGSTLQAFTAGARFVLINRAVKFIEVNAAETGIAFNHRAVPAGKQIEDATDVPFTWTGEIIQSNQYVEGSITAEGNIIAEGEVNAEGGYLVSGVQVISAQQPAVADVAANIPTTLATTAGAAYTAAEQTMINDLAAKLNAALTVIAELKAQGNDTVERLREHGLVAT